MEHALLLVNTCDEIKFLKIKLQWLDVVRYLVNFEINIIHKQIENFITINNLYIIC